jgi:membrane protein DedA with SNARE-associated domain
VLVVPMVAFAVSANLATAFAPTLLVHEPVWLITLSSRMRWLVLVSPRLDPFTYFAIPMIRLLAVAAVYYVFGRRYGDRAVRWLESKMGGASQPILWIERQFHRARYVVVFLLPAGAFVSLLAGADEMPPRRYFATTTLGLVARLLVVRLVAGAFTDMILHLTDWVAANQIWLTGVSVASVLAFALWSRRSGRGEIESIDEVAEELGEI